MENGRVEFLIKSSHWNVLVNSTENMSITRGSSVHTLFRISPTSSLHICSRFCEARISFRSCKSSIVSRSFEISFRATPQIRAILQNLSHTEKGDTWCYHWRVKTHILNEIKEIFWTGNNRLHYCTSEKQCHNFQVKKSAPGSHFLLRFYIGLTNRLRREITYCRPKRALNFLK